ncbi:MAG: hypothetical protein QOK10_1397 [Pseudonocardiales bacterium]|nr:hypothetical protein [Pseudonocardiales bacterium]
MREQQISDDAARLWRGARDSPDSTPKAAEISIEQKRLDTFYGRLDEVTAETAAALEGVRRAPTAGTPAAMSERDAFATLHADHLAQLNAVGDRLCFGRLDLAGGELRYVGRIGLRDEQGGRLLIDWRAPAAEAFYRATPADPHGAISRRHLTTSGRTVTAISDEVLDLDAFTELHGATDTVSEDGALMLALNANRTGQMHDIVATIQAEQDQVIRDQLAGVLVVQGGPGTGKTAVALHRAAYLLYAHRDRLGRSGVLLVGPNTRFLNYIEQVLPSLGETGVVMLTPGQLYPGVDASAVDEPEVAVIKGRVRMARLISGAVRARQRVPSMPIPLNVDGTKLVLTPADVEQARRKARATHKPHNQARTVFATELLRLLVTQYAAALGMSLEDEEGRQDVRPELLSALRESPDVRREVNLCWLPISPQRLVADLYADPRRLAEADPQLDARDRAKLRRARGSEWTVDDVPLLDEAAELLGDDDVLAEREAERARAERATEIEFATAVLNQSSGADYGDDDAPSLSEMMTAEDLAARYAGPRTSRTAAERGAVERDWAFGHLIVDEAQELSAMQWRMLMRRVPSQSMTLVGDPAQTGSATGARSWGQVLRPYVRDRWRLRELTVNYRTPAQIMSAATDLLDAAGISSTPVSSARATDWPPIAQRIEPEDTSALLAAVGEELAVDSGSVAVIVAAGRHELVWRAVTAAVPSEHAGRISVLTARQVKGLEFDSVILIEPAEIVAESARGVNDLYVAMTRPTQRLRILHSAALPAGLAALSTPR